MARYISLLRFTEQGAKNLQKSTNRAHNFDKIAARAGVKIEGQYWTMGAYDLNPAHLDDEKARFSPVKLVFL
jgi:uncharacterized protein with GYD domain